MNEFHSIECPVEGKPTPQIKWFKDNELIISQPTHLEQAAKELMLFNIVDDDTGDYHCEAANYLGTIRSDQFRLQVQSSKYKNNIALAIMFIPMLIFISLSKPRCTALCYVKHAPNSHYYYCSCCCCCYFCCHFGCSETSSTLKWLIFRENQKYRPQLHRFRQVDSNRSASAIWVRPTLRFELIRFGLAQVRRLKAEASDWSLTWAPNLNCH